jgi:hypothetical protein
MTEDNRVDLLARFRDVDAEPALVDNDTPPPVSAEGSELDEEASLQRRRCEREEQSKLAAVALSKMKLSPAHLARGEQVRKRFEEAGTDGDDGEKLLEELTAREVPIALALQDLESTLAALLAKAVLEPEPALHVTRAFKEVVGLSGAIRTRMQNCLSAAANLRAHRSFLKEHRRPSGG